MAISKLNPSAGGIPFGDTAGRPTAATGKLYSNGETARLELYTSAGAWENIVQEVPGVASIGGQYLETNNSNTITIYGTNFVSGATAYAVGTNAVEVAATSTTYNSLVQLTAVFTGLTAANEPYDIKVVNPSNLFGILPDALLVNNQLAWTTSAGSLGSFGDAVAISVSATASDDSTITYAVASGSSLPSGITLNTATGLISGTLPDVASNTTYTFTLTASDGSNPAVSRQFSFTSNAAPIWVTSSGSLGTFNEGSSLNLTLEATDVSDTVSYALNSGSSLPSGITLNSSTGVISGTLPDISTDTTYSFTINASDGINIVSRSFSITSTYTIPVEYLVVGGGGAGGSRFGGGGGAGGFRSGTLSLRSGNLTVTVGTGGTPTINIRGSNGNNSVFSTITAAGGGGGAAENDPASNGGSGGGGSYASSAPGSGNTPSTSPSQGFSGGTGQATVRLNAGGGGASEAGAGSGSRGNGGAGSVSSITGSSITYAGGGGGADNRTDGGGQGTGSQPWGTGGAGGGGDGGGTESTGTGDSRSGVGTNGTDGLGGGGGGGAYAAPNGRLGGNGGSGVVIIAYPSIYPELSSIGVGLTYNQPTRSGFRVYRFTAGTGSITF